MRYRASWILPIAGEPIRDGWVSLNRGRIVALGHGSEDGEQQGAECRLGSVAILPGLVNAHTHLELSHLRDRVPSSRQFVSWVRGVLDARRRSDDRDVARGVEAGIAESIRSGTALVGDITNTLVTFDPLIRSDLGGVVFYELIRFNAPDPVSVAEQARARVRALPTTDRVRASLAAHAPYSVAPLLFRAIRQAIDPSWPCSVHLSESSDEVEFIRGGGGAWRAFLEEVGAWDPAWTPPGCSPVQSLDESGFLDDRTLAVHGVQMTSADLARLVSRGTTLVACPRSNGHTGAGAPPVAEFYAAGVRVAIGTDSLASTPDLSVFAELAAMRALAPSVPAARLLDSATRQGARALGFDADYGTIEPGKLARLLAVSVPDGLADVEEYLVSGVRPEQVRWLDA